MCDFYGETCFDKNFNKWAEHRFATASVHEVETILLFCKENVPVATVRKEGQAEGHLGHERTNHF